jgi:ABC-2 type transport system ATP-binding protein
MGGSKMAVRDLVVGYGARTVLHGVDLDLMPGEILGLLGPNGAGKSTLLRRMAGVLPGRSGSIEVEGAGDPAVDRAARGRIGYMPEAPALYPDETALRYVTYLADLAGIPRRRRRDAALQALEQTGAAALADRLCGRLSKGQRQRVAMAGAIVHGPDVILLDEPGEGLDPRQTVALRALLRTLATRSAVLFSTHLLSEAQVTCDRIVILDQGSVVADRPAPEAEDLESIFLSVVGRDWR